MEALRQEARQQSPHQPMFEVHLNHIRRVGPVAADRRLERLSPRIGAARRHSLGRSRAFSPPLPQIVESVGPGRRRARKPDPRDRNGRSRPCRPTRPPRFRDSCRRDRGRSPRLAAILARRCRHARASVRGYRASHRDPRSRRSVPGAFVVIHLGAGAREPLAVGFGDRPPRRAPRPGRADAIRRSAALRRARR